MFARLRAAIGATSRAPVPTSSRTPSPLLVDGRSIPVELRRSTRARRMTLRADAVHGCVRLTLPPRGSTREALAFLSAHENWLRVRIARWPAATPFTPGTQIPFDGGTLTIEPGPGRGVTRDGDRLVVGGAADALPGRVGRWLKAAALADLTARTHALAAAHGLGVAAVSIRDPAARWGSCSSSGRIAYSWRLILAPPAVRASVVAHEVAHLVHHNHGTEFWACAKAFGGDPTPHRRWLASHGAALHWIGRADP